MGITTYNDMVIYQAEFHSGLAEGVTQNLDAVNAASRGTIRVVANEHRGDYKKQSFWKKKDLIVRRDDTSTSATTPVTMDADEVISVKVKRRAETVDVHYDALQSAESSMAEAARLYGKDVGEQKLEDMINTALVAAVAALSGESDVVFDITGAQTKTVSPAALNSALAKFGDRAQRLRMWAMHSKPNFDVVGHLIAQDVTGLTDIATIQGAIPALLGRPALVTDSSGLTDANGSATDTFNTLALADGAIVIEESDPEIFLMQDVLGRDNLAKQLQAEYSYTLTIKGFKWDVGNGGRNPTIGTIGTSSNWDKVATSLKDLAGVLLVSQ